MENNIKQETLEEDNNFFEKLKQYFETTPREKVLEDWDKSTEYNKVGPTIDDFLNNINNQQILEQAIKYYAHNYFDMHDDTYNYKALERGFEAGAKWQQAQNKNIYSEADMREAYFTAIESTGEGWNGEYAGRNHPNIEETFNDGFKIFIEQHKNK
jgi:hypothetical protein